MNKDTIYREDAIALVSRPICPTGNSDYDNEKEAEREAIKESLMELPSADRPQGEWIAKDGVFYCSCCDNDSAGLSEDDVYVYETPLPNYCKYCGAKMKGADNE